MGDCLKRILSVRSDGGPTVSCQMDLESKFRNDDGPSCAILAASTIFWPARPWGFEHRHLWQATVACNLSFALCGAQAARDRPDKHCITLFNMKFATWRHPRRLARGRQSADGSKSTLRLAEIRCLRSDSLDAFVHKSHAEQQSRSLPELANISLASNRGWDLFIMACSDAPCAFFDNGFQKLPRLPKKHVGTCDKRALASVSPRTDAPRIPIWDVRR